MGIAIQILSGIIRLIFQVLSGLVRMMFRPFR